MGYIALSALSALFICAGGGSGGGSGGGGGGVGGTGRRGSLSVRSSPFLDLPHADPDAPVRDRKAHDMVDEGFGPARAGRHAEDVGEEFFDHLQVRGGVEGGGEAEEGARAAEAVAREVKLRCGVYCGGGGFSEVGIGGLASRGRREREERKGHPYDSPDAS